MLGSWLQICFGDSTDFLGQVKCSCVIVQSATQAGQHHHFNSGRIPRSLMQISIFKFLYSILCALDLSTNKGWTVATNLPVKTHAVLRTKIRRHRSPGFGATSGRTFCMFFFPILYYTLRCFAIILYHTLRSFFSNSKTLLWGL